MKKVFKNSIERVTGTDSLESNFVFEIQTGSLTSSKDMEIVDMRKLLEKKKNISVFEKTKIHPAMWSEVYSPKDELEIFTKILDETLKSGNKVHIVGVTLGEEIELLEKYYLQMGFFREEINCFDVDYSQVQISASVYIENMMWRGSDYKRMGEKIFFCPPIRESGEVKNLFRGLNRGSIAGIVIEVFDESQKEFLKKCLLDEHILPLTLGRTVSYNFIDLGLSVATQEFEVSF